VGRTTWLARLGPPLLVLGAIAVPAVAGQGPNRQGPPGGCPRAFVDRALTAQPPSAGGAAAGAWFRLGSVLDPAGALVGQTFDAGTTRRSIHRDLPAESSGSGPFGAALVVTADDGTSSTVELVDAATGCAIEVDRTTDVIRRATIQTATRTLFEHRLDGADRSSLGIWGRSIDGSAAERLLEPIADDPAFGRTFSTELAWDETGHRLAIQSCGAVACRTRIAAMPGGPIRLVANHDLGELIGLMGDRLVTYGTCRSLPCPVFATSLTDGARTMLVAEAGLARTFSDGGLPRLAVERGGVGSGRIDVLAADGSRLDSVDVGPDRLLVPATWRAGEADATPDGWLVVAADRSSGARPGRRLVRPATGETLDLPAEVWS